MIDFCDYMCKAKSRLSKRASRIVDATTRQVVIDTEPYEFITSAPFKEGDEALIRHDKGVNKVIFVRDKQGHGWLVDTGWSLSE